MSNIKYSLVSFLEKNPELIKSDDWNKTEEQINDALFCRNLDLYLQDWIKENGEQIIRDFHKSKSDANPMEDEVEEKYISNFVNFLSSI